MKKIRLILLLIASLFVLWALTWPSSCKVVLEYENNMNNTGSGSYTFTSSSPFSTTYKELGTYSIGPIPSQAGAIYSSGAVNEVVQKFQTWIYPLSSQPTIGAIYSNSNGDILYYYAGGVYFYNPFVGQIGPFTCSFNNPHVIITTADGAGHQDLYIDGVHQGQLATYQPTNLSWTIGARNSGEYCNCYFDDTIFSTDNSTAGSEITPIPPTPTFTVTLTPTSTPTLTPTFTITQTPTPMYAFFPTPPVTSGYIKGYLIQQTGQPEQVILKDSPQFFMWNAFYQYYALFEPPNIFMKPLY